MNVSSERYRQKAAECDRLAEREHFARIAARYRDLARRWREVAQLAERLERSSPSADPDRAGDEAPPLAQHEPAAGFDPSPIKL